MALYERFPHGLDKGRQEIPYGYKNLWQITVNSFNLATQTFNESDIVEIILNGNNIQEPQMRKLYDYNRDGASIRTALIGDSIFATVSGFSDGVYSFQLLVAQNLEISGLLGVTGDMVDNTDPQRPVIGHDDQKLDAASYTSDQAALNTRLTADESNIAQNTASIANLGSTKISSVTFNGTAATVTGGTAAITADVVNAAGLAAGLSGKVDKASLPNPVMTGLQDALDADTGVLTLAKSYVNPSTGAVTSNSTQYDLMDLLGIDDLKALDHTLYYFIDAQAFTPGTGAVSISDTALYRFADDGTKVIPTTTDGISFVFALDSDYSSFGVLRKKYISAIGYVKARTATALSVEFTNNRAIVAYNRYNGYPAGTVVIDPDLNAPFRALQAIPVPTAETSVIALTNELYYAPIVDYSPMPTGTVWANLEAADGPGDAYGLPTMRLALLDVASGYDNYIAFIGATIPAEITTDADWTSNIALWVTDGYQFTSLSALLAYLGNFASADRFKLSNRGILTTHYEAGGITLSPVFTRETLTTGNNALYQPIPPTATAGGIPVYNDASILTDSTVTIAQLATAAQGAKADTAVQSIVLAPGGANGQIKVTVDGVDQSAAVTGLGSAAYQAATAFATAAQGTKADTALQSAALASGAQPGTLTLTTNGVTQAAVSVPGLGSAAYEDTASFATAAQGANADSAIQSLSITAGASNGTISYVINGGAAATASVAGLGTSAYQPASAFATAAQGAKADTALQTSDIVDNASSTDGTVPLSANQGRVLQQQINAIKTAGRPIGGFATYADRYLNTSDYASDLQPIAAGDYIYIAADETHTNQPAQYSVSAIDGSGVITYAFVRIVPASQRDFTAAPIQSTEIASGAVGTAQIQNNSITGSDIQNGAVTSAKLSADLQAQIGANANALKTPVSTSGTGNVVTNVSANADNTLSVALGNAVTNVQVTGAGSFVASASVANGILSLVKTGTAITGINFAGTGNAIVDASLSGSILTLTRGITLSSVANSGTGNVVTDISINAATGAMTATKGRVMTGITKSGTGNAVTDVTMSADGATATAATGTFYNKIAVSGTGNGIANVTATGDTITVVKGDVGTPVTPASTTTQGIVMLNDTLTSTAANQALTANQGRVLDAKISANDAAYVKLSGNQTINDIKTLAMHPIVPSKTTVPTAGASATQYATEAQVFTRVKKPDSAVIGNLAAFDANGNVIDSGVAPSGISVDAITDNDIDAIINAAFA